MKKIFLSTIFLTFLIFISCLKDSGENQDVQKTEIITEGEKWTLRIGSTPEEVFTQLQTLGAEKKFQQILLTEKKPFSNPKEIDGFWQYYDEIIIIDKTSERSYIVVFEIDKVKGIHLSGIGFPPVEAFPENMNSNQSIVRGDTALQVYEKLLKIYEAQPFNISLAFKSLNKKFDPDMVNHKNWIFSFHPKARAFSQVQLDFKDNKLNKITHIYSEGMLQ